MNYFPQLAQFPIRRRTRQRTIVNEMEDGRQVKSKSNRPDILEWQVDLGVLSGAERDQVVDVWSACHGARDPFVYVDPTENLLLQSDDLSAGVWAKDPDVRVVGRVVQNEGQTTGRIVQTIQGPAWFQYCFSFLARSLSTTNFSAIRIAGGSVDRLSATAGTDWNRILLCSHTASAEETIQFGIELAPGTRVELAEIQVEAQIANSAYKPTTTRGGIHPAARFASDELSVVEEGVDWSSMTIRIRTTEL
jgi:hypothetical protein